MSAADMKLLITESTEALLSRRQLWRSAQRGLHGMQQGLTLRSAVRIETDLAEPIVKWSYGVVVSTQDSDSNTLNAFLRPQFESGLDLIPSLFLFPFAYEAYAFLSDVF